MNAMSQQPVIAGKAFEFAGSIHVTDSLGDVDVDPHSEVFRQPCCGV